MLDSPAGGGGSGHFEVTPAELNSAANTLRGVTGELDVFADVCADLGSPKLYAAVNEFLHQARVVASQLELTVVGAAAEVAGAANNYTATDNAQMHGNG